MLECFVLADTFETHRDYLLGLAYRMLGSVADAEDMVQETYLRWQRTGSPALEQPRVWFAKTCTRLCIDRLRALKRQREHYIGPWLPEPLVATVPGDAMEMDETLSMALLCVIERLTPNERAVFLLHDVFQYSFKQAADVLGLTEANCRQLAVRARRHVREQRPTVQQVEDPEVVQDLGRAFFAAARQGDEMALRALLADGVVLRSDGGGKAMAVLKPMVGSQAVARFFARVMGHPSVEGLSLMGMVFNGAPGWIVLEDDQLATVCHFEVGTVEGQPRIVGVYAVRNPDKLAGMAGLLEAGQG